MRMVRQLGREDWIAAGVEALALRGPNAVAVQALARRLGVSKGSFYWHFRDRAALRDAILDYWEHRMVAQMVRGPRSQDPAAKACSGAGMATGQGTVSIAGVGGATGRKARGTAAFGQGRATPPGPQRDAPERGGPERGGPGLASADPRGAGGARPAAHAPDPASPQPGSGGSPASFAGLAPLSGTLPHGLLPALREWAREDAAVARKLALVAAEAGRSRNSGTPAENGRPGWGAGAAFGRPEDRKEAVPGTGAGLWPAMAAQPVRVA